jgi:hypothetical protein
VSIDEWSFAKEKALAVKEIPQPRHDLSEIYRMD